MLTHHSDLSLYAGDSWTIVCTLINAGGEVVDLTNADVFWMLISPDGEEVADLAENVTVAVQDPPTAGIVHVTVPYGYTAGLKPGRYTDSVRVIAGSSAETSWYGQLVVNADPFGVPLET